MESMSGTPSWVSPLISSAPISIIRLAIANPVRSSCALIPHDPRKQYAHASAMKVRYHLPHSGYPSRGRIMSCWIAAVDSVGIGGPDQPRRFHRICFEYFEITILGVGVSRRVREMRFSGSPLPRSSFGGTWSARMKRPIAPPSGAAAFLTIICGWKKVDCVQ
jgi:hypothetical protein